MHELNTFLSCLNQRMSPLLSTYCRPKYHVSLKPNVRHVNSNRSLPDAFNWKQQFNVSSKTINNYLYTSHAGEAGIALAVSVHVWVSLCVGPCKDGKKMSNRSWCNLVGIRVNMNPKSDWILVTSDPDLWHCISATTDHQSMTPTLTLIVMLVITYP